MLVLYLNVLTASNIINKEITRNIDATTAIVRVNSDIKVQAKSSGAYDYHIVFPNSQAEHLSFLSVTVKGKASPLTISPPVM